MCIHCIYIVNQSSWKMGNNTPTNRDRGTDTTYVIRMQKKKYMNQEQNKILITG